MTSSWQGSQIDGVRWWSLALAAYGQPAAPLRMMRAAWAAVAAEPPPPELGEQRGYPGWLADCVDRAARASTPHIEAAS